MSGESRESDPPPARANFGAVESRNRIFRKMASYSQPGCALSGQLRSAAMTAEELRDWRARFGVTQAQLTRDLGYHGRANRDKVSQWERGLIRIPPMLPLALRSLEALMRRRAQLAHDLAQGIPAYPKHW